jgi:hypothetical protein
VTINAGPPRSAFGKDPEFGALSREIEKRVRHVPLRQLFHQMLTALTKLATGRVGAPSHCYDRLKKSTPHEGYRDLVSLALTFMPGAL